MGDPSLTFFSVLFGNKGYGHCNGMSSRARSPKVEGYTLHIGTVRTYANVYLVKRCMTKPAVELAFCDG